MGRHIKSRRATLDGLVVGIELGASACLACYGGLEPKEPRQRGKLRASGRQSSLGGSSWVWLWEEGAPNLAVEEGLALGVGVCLV